MKRALKHASTAVALLILTGILFSVVYANLSPGKKAPNFTLPTIDGKKFTLSDKKKAKHVVVMDIWATWCPPCRGEIPYLIKIKKDMSGKSFTMVGIAIDDEKDAVQKFAKEHGINYTVALDPKGNKLGNSYGIGGIPTTYVIDKKGVIRYVHEGFPRDSKEQSAEAANIKKEINKLLSEK